MGISCTKWALGSDQSSVRPWPSAAAGRCAGSGSALIRQLANREAFRVFLSDVMLIEVYRFNNCVFMLHQ